MKQLLLYTILLYATLVFSQENWDYLPIEITNDFPGHGAICPIDENVVHVVSDGGYFYNTEDGGETWSQFDSGVNEIFLDLDFDGTQNGYAVGAEGNILKTDNAGQTWAALSSGTTEALVSVSVNAENSIWAVGNNGIVLHSTNGGNSWTLNTSLTSENLNDIKFKDENIGYIAGDNGVLFYTQNGGIDWEELQIPSSNDLFSISLTEDFIYLIAGDAESYDSEFGFSGNFLFKSENNSDWIFHDLTPWEHGPADICFILDDTGFTVNSVALLSDQCFVYIEKTENSGETWEYSLNEETNAANCHANSGYAKIDFPSENVGYALVGKKIFKTPYNSAGVDDFDKNNSFTIYPNPTENGNFNLKLNIQELDGISI
ncbi:MAG TPA: YCF48-related protein, partial [Aequorivita sp.]|nr:YCF48-related protein [Aequorivita sp.]